MIEATERFLVNQDWITVILLILIALLIFNKIIDPERFTKIRSLIYSSAYINNYSKSTPLLLNTFNIVFYIVFIFVISLIILVAVNQYAPLLIVSEISYFFTTILYVFSFMAIRLLIGFLLGVLFNKEKEQQFFTFQKVSYLGNLCLLILPLLIINFYVNSINFSIFLVVVTILLLLYYYMLLIKNNQKQIFSRMFYFILYLCALEIAPLVIIYKLFII